MIGRRLTDPLQTEDPNDRRVPEIVRQVMAEYEDQIVIPSMAEIRQKLGLEPSAPAATSRNGADASGGVAA